MLFNSLEFLVFLPLTFLAYWLLKRFLNVQNALILVASYVFYGWWDTRFLTLVAFSSIADFFIARLIESEHSQKKRKALLLLSLVINLGILGFFKYCNFFIESFTDLSQTLGFQANIQTLKIILPVGISFYTFQTLSYTIDIYRKKLSAARSLLNFMAYVSFFPQLVAGPIERATSLLPQFQSRREFDYNLAVSGCKLILWGLIKKVIIADNCAYFVNDIFDSPYSRQSTTLILGSVLFAFQIYGDFSGYSDIAIGVGRLFGFRLMRNFNYPYFSRNIGEFWRRWHISLSTWFRDYVYIPLGGSKGSSVQKIRNIAVIFLLSGFWHGANLTFLAWGALNALYFIPLMFMNKNRKYVNKPLSKGIPGFRELFTILLTFICTSVAWIFFRAENLETAFDIFKIIILTLPQKSGILASYNYLAWTDAWWLPILLVFFVLIEWLQKEHEHPFGLLSVFPKFIIC